MLAAGAHVVAVGNDVVDLGDPETRLGGLHRRFEERVFAAAEREALAASADRHRLLWALWAAKESAYKALKQLDPSLVFSPRELTVELETGALSGIAARARVPGLVRSGSAALVVEVSLEGDRLHAVAVSARGGADESPARSRAAVLSQVVAAAEDGGRAARRLAIDALAAALGVDASVLSIGGRPPRLFDGGVPLDVPLSLSHHGRFVAFAAAVPAHLAGSAPFVRVAIE